MLRKLSLVPAVLLLGLQPEQALAAEALNYQIYGQVNLGLLNANNADGDRVWQVENQASRLGIKGKQEIDGGLSLIYQYETGINPSSGDKPIFSQRNAFVGLAGGFGELLLGNFDTPLKLAQQKVDLFNDTAFDMSELLAGEVRHAQSVQYRTPKLAGLNASVDWLPSQEKDQEDGISAALHYSNQAISLNLAMDNKVSGDGGVITKKTSLLNNYRATASFKLGDDLTFGVLAQLSEGVEQDKTKEHSWLFSTKWQLNKVALKAQLGQGLAVKDEVGSNADNRLEHMALGLDYALAKNTQLYAYSGLARERDAQAQTETESRTGLGVKYKF